MKKENVVENLAAVKKEVENCMSRLFAGPEDNEKWRYFGDLALKYFCSPQKERDRVLLLGTGMPEELIYAAGLKPWWVIGGSYEISWTVDSMVPRDADAIYRSIFGYVEQNTCNTARTAIAPITCDCMRKLAYTLQMRGQEVLAVDIPPDKNDSAYIDKLSEQLDHIFGARSVRWLLPGGGARLRTAAGRVDRAKASLNEFLRHAQGRVEEISGLLRMFLINTYYYADDLDEWSEKIEELTRSLSESRQSYICENKKPKVLLIGSPILFPNYKIPFLVEDVGLDIFMCCDSVSNNAVSRVQGGLQGSKNALLKKLARKQLDHDISGGYILNRSLIEKARSLMDSGKVDGVIYHIIKGQIEYDFELERIESLFTERDIPVFRVETDYFENDLEQIRLRLEAFAEMLKVEDVMSA